MQIVSKMLAAENFTQSAKCLNATCYSELFELPPAKGFETVSSDKQNAKKQQKYHKLLKQNGKQLSTSIYRH